MIRSNRNLYIVVHTKVSPASRYLNMFVRYFAWLHTILHQIYLNFWYLFPDIQHNGSNMWLFDPHAILSPMGYSGGKSP